MLKDFQSRQRPQDLHQPINPQFRDYPAPFLLATIEEFKKRNGQVIVEIGSMRMPMNHPILETHHDCCCDGHSSMYFGTLGKEFWSVDIDPGANNTTKEGLRKFGCPTDKIILGDGLGFLRGFHKQIDLLVLDAWDVDLEDSEDKHLEAYEIAKRLLHEESLILIDDTDVYRNAQGQVVFGNGKQGKGSKVIPKAESDGWVVKFSGRQTLLSRY